MIRSAPNSLIRSASAPAVIPESTVIIKRQPSPTSFLIVAAPRPYPSSKRSGMWGGGFDSGNSAVELVLIKIGKILGRFGNQIAWFWRSEEFLLVLNSSVAEKGSFDFFQIIRLPVANQFPSFF